MTWRVEQGDCLDVLQGLPDASVDAVCTDPPYGLSFMGTAWDTFDPATMEQRVGRRGGNGPPSDVHDGRSKGRTKSAFANPGCAAGAYDLSPTANRRFQAWCEAWAAECLRVLKPGGHLLAFGGTRTYHRLAAGIEDAGFEVRDTLAWMFGSGFAKSWNFDTQFRGDWCSCREPGGALRDGGRCPRCGGLSKAYVGHGTALKPGHEPIVLARKPLAGTVAGNVLEWGCGAINVDGCRIATDDRWKGAGQVSPPSSSLSGGVDGSLNVFTSETHEHGRWPANVVLDPEAAALVDEQAPAAGAQRPVMGTEPSPPFRSDGVYGDMTTRKHGPFYGDAGGASRFFYCAKTSSLERNAGLDGFEIKRPDRDTGHTDGRQWDIPGSHSTPRANVHPTVKPIDLMRWLVRLVTPPGGTVLDPFAGSGTTGCACVLEGFDFVGVEREAEYLAIARARIGWWEQHPQGLDTDDALRAGRARDGVAAAGQLGLLDGEAA